jgi:acyl dehydratase
MSTKIAVPAVGDHLEPKEHKPLTRTDIVRYAGASGDFNPIHHDDTFASSAGFPTVFSIGMYQAGLLANYAADRFGPDNVRRVTLRFSSQVWPGDVLTCEGVITSVGAGDDGTTTVELDLTCRRRGSDGSEGFAVTGSAMFALA